MSEPPELSTEENPENSPLSRRERLQRLRTRAKSAVSFVSGVCAVLVALLLYNALVPGPHQITPQEVNQSIANAMASATPAPAYSSQVYQVIRPSFVLIQTNKRDPNSGSAFADPSDEAIAAEATAQTDDKSAGLGSGVIINADGNILTSLHVVNGADKIDVTFADGTESKAEIISTQPENDIAVLQAAKLPKQVVPATLGNPGSLRIGDEAYVVGNPLGLYGSMSGGIISGLERSFQPQGSEQMLKGLIQFDAAANPGNSGGPLMNRYGQVVGIVTGIVNPTDQDVFIGIAFAVPINTAAGGAGMPAY